MNRIRVAVIGTGWWAQQHLRAFSENRKAELVGVCGRTEETTRKRAARFGVPAYIDVDAMLAEAQPDLVSICLPNQAHFEPTLKVLRAGAHLIVEKPLVFDLQEADVLLAEARERRLFFAICFNHRYARAVRLAHEAVMSGKLGDLVLATWRFGGEGAADHPYNNLIETQCHGFDQLEHLAGPITSVAAQFSDRTRRGAYTSLAISIGFQSGAAGALIGSYDGSYAHPGAHRLELIGSKGRVVVEDTVRRFIFNAHGSETSEIWEPGYFNDRDRQFMLTLDAYLEDALTAFREGREPPVHARSGRRALELAHAAIRSHETGQKVVTLG